MLILKIAFLCCLAYFVGFRKLNKPNLFFQWLYFLLSICGGLIFFFAPLYYFGLGFGAAVVFTGFCAGVKDEANEEIDTNAKIDVSFLINLFMTTLTFWPVNLWEIIYFSIKFLKKEE